MPARPGARGVHSCTRYPAYQHNNGVVATEFHKGETQLTHLMSKQRKLLKQTVKQSRNQSLERQMLRKRGVLVEGAGEEDRSVFRREILLALRCYWLLCNVIALPIRIAYGSVPHIYTLERSRSGAKARARKAARLRDFCLCSVLLMARQHSVHLWRQ